MKFSVARADITPDKPVFMHGFGARTRQTDGTLDSLYMKAVLLQANTALLIVTIDALGSDRSFVVGIKDALQSRFGFKHEEVLINFSHTHHSVFLTGTDVSLRKGGYSMGQTKWANDESELEYGEDEIYFRRLRDTLLEMVGNCFAELREGELWIGKGLSDFAVSRRRPRADGGVDWMPYYEGEIDKDLFVLRLDAADGGTSAILFCYGCHTTAMGPDNYRFSNDYAGYAAAKLEAEFPGALAVFVQGCGGELKPRPTAEGDEFIGCADAEGLRKVGEVLAGDVLRVLNERPFRKVACRFGTKLLDPLIYTEQTPAEFYGQIAADPRSNSFYVGSALRTVRSIGNGTVKDRIPFCISLWRLDGETNLIAMEGEVSTEYGLKLKRLFGNGSTIVLGYTNGLYSYVPTRKMIGEGGYEASCNYFFGLRGPFIPEIEDIIVGQIAQGLKALDESAPAEA